MMILFILSVSLFIIVEKSLAYDSNYVLTTAQRYVELCGAAYCTDPKLRKNCVDDWSCKISSKFPNMTATSFHSSLYDGNGFVGYDGDANEVIVSFSGTNPLSIRDWIDDLDFIKTSYPYCEGCNVHQGFYNTYLSLNTDVKNLVTSYQSQHPSATLAITGHSLGAALAAHCAAEYTHMGQIISTVYSYGMPRVGDDAFENWYKNTLIGTFRVVHHKDPVPHLPTESMGFHHMPYEVNIRNICILLILHVLSPNYVYFAHSMCINCEIFYLFLSTTASILLLLIIYRCFTRRTTTTGSSAASKGRTPLARTSTQ